MDLSAAISLQRDYYNKNVTKDISFRRNSLEKLLDTITEYESAIYEALKADLGKAKQESFMTEVSQVTGSIKYAIKHLEAWSRSKRVHTPLSLLPGKSEIVKEPYGVVLIMAPWNYPFLLSMSPLVAAIAAGNCVILKSSKSSPHTSSVVVDIINSTFERNHVYAIEEVLPYDEILRQKYDYIFFTGSERVGKNILKAAAENLTPVTLELGGKSPCIIDETADIEKAARKIMWGKLLNAGQTCVAPDYVYIHESVKKKFVEEATGQAREMLGDPFMNSDYPHIVSLHHYMRLKNLIAKETEVIGGRGDDDRLIIEPTILPNATFESLAMKNEIFGPILPIIEYEDKEELYITLKNRPKPLACYIFSENSDFIDYVKENIAFGGGCVNDVVLHLSNEALPFGGVGNSGMGHYHGKAGFDTFTHEKSVYEVPSWWEMPFRFHPYSEKALNSIKKVLKQ